MSTGQVVETFGTQNVADVRSWSDDGLVVLISHTRARPRFLDEGSKTAEPRMKRLTGCPTHCSISTNNNGPDLVRTDFYTLLYTSCRQPPYAATSSTSRHHHCPCLTEKGTLMPVPRKPAALVIVNLGASYID